MRAFARLYTALDETTSTSEKIAALVAYFRTAPPRDAAWAVHFLIGRRPKRLVPSAPACGPGPPRRPASPTGCSRRATTPSATWPRPSRCCCPTPAPPATCRSRPGSRSGCCGCAGRTRRSSATSCVRAWRELDRRERYVWNKLITGSFRVGASARLVVRALADASGVDEGTVAHRLMGAWDPSAEFFERLVARGYPRRRRQPPLPVLSGLPARGHRRIRSAPPPIGWPSGSGTASGPSSSAARAAPSSGPGARSC